MADDLVVKPGSKVNLRHIDTSSKKGVPAREKADAETEKNVALIGKLQDVLYGNGRRSLLIILQGMDAAGKDGTVRRVFDEVNPTGVVVTSFKAPSALELRHDFLWRCHKDVPPRGSIGVFNRSYYEEVLVVRVHRDKLLPPELQSQKHLWNMRFKLINDFEQLLELNGTAIVKFFLHISKEEQRKRFVERQQDPDKQWKLSPSDFEERQFWDDYQDAYEEMLTETSTDHAPWHIIPADHKWVRNYHIASIVAGALKDMKLAYPKLADPSLLRRRFD